MRCVSVLKVWEGDHRTGRKNIGLSDPCGVYRYYDPQLRYHTTRALYSGRFPSCRSSATETGRVAGDTLDAGAKARRVNLDTSRRQISLSGNPARLCCFQVRC